MEFAWNSSFFCYFQRGTRLYVGVPSYFFRCNLLLDPGRILYHNFSTVAPVVGVLWRGKGFAYLFARPAAPRVLQLEQPNFAGRCKKRCSIFHQKRLRRYRDRRAWQAKYMLFKKPSTSEACNFSPRGSSKLKQSFLDSLGPELSPCTLCLIIFWFTIVSQEKWTRRDFYMGGGHFPDAPRNGFPRKQSNTLAH